MEIPTIHELATEKTDSTTISYFKLRQLIGLLGIFLPFALVIFGGRLQPSLSHYYYSFSHTFFVGTLAALSTFLITYKGVYRLEDWLANIAGFCAAGVAIFPQMQSVSWENLFLICQIGQKPPIGATFCTTVLQPFCLSVLLYFVLLFFKNPTKMR
ncbi:hypothetical protein [Frigoriflavimonas asaccharolytica]|uniref:Uncharacterized protein n=1 Tax=Frigoriflavimonas asaccharolytica TaxID=2735899 RepID=A0A8J8G7H4_9FLAO|nr:hypothetical protein [Frigoriflavimonas asaccharolytica]NRS92588.1 hypothetical protein [Frigoriflavimonas asaccharolytica]